MALELINVCKTFSLDREKHGLEVLVDISCRIEEGEFVSLVGPSGCGKTTLLKIIAGLERATRGRVLLDGFEIASQTDKVGLVFQEYALFPWRTTLQNIVIGLEIMGVNKKERLAAGMEYVNMFGLKGFENRYPCELSGGMQQRVAIARTLIMGPKVVLMDEPFGSLDSQTRNDLQEFLLDLWQKRQDTVLFVTHNVDEAVFLSDEILVLSKRPARIITRFQVDCPRPRDRTSVECNIIRREILSTLRGERVD
ncbi:MAG: ABC transporter ATP-binding protein [Deltaproteobacteria bacterium]|nr:ABC transporter ATP-binding protein [Deltaproteobacteria bacterium]MBW1929514.1 ABC transporter ATP-binding protein [Deltaproteobacteria bacterium]MBW2024070.1 ABC transporter ATP-binding protein [Deltaproteobacteria bacterium]MBW2124421.1 ABC transporter ATP-binding protein [Deltaproteobacteria bacterium]RLB24551.1 MAG: nitrate ABC transporter ATP-binding protein [Deltaproteobacteria bacterium]